MEVHKAKAGYTPAQTDAEFLSIAKDLPRYGEHLFLAKVGADRGCGVGGRDTEGKYACINQGEPRSNVVLC